MKNIVFRRMFVVIFTIVIGVVCAAGAAKAQQDNDSLTCSDSTNAATPG